MEAMLAEARALEEELAALQQRSATDLCEKDDAEREASEERRDRRARKRDEDQSNSFRDTTMHLAKQALAEQGLIEEQRQQRRQAELMVQRSVATTKTAMPLSAPPVPSRPASVTSLPTAIDPLTATRGDEHASCPEEFLADAQHPTLERPPTAQQAGGQQRGGVPVQAGAAAVTESPQKQDVRPPVADSTQSQIDVQPKGRPVPKLVGKQTTPSVEDLAVKRTALTTSKAQQNSTTFVPLGQKVISKVSASQLEAARGSAFVGAAQDSVAVFIPPDQAKDRFKMVKGAWHDVVEFESPVDEVIREQEQPDAKWPEVKGQSLDAGVPCLREGNIKPDTLQFQQKAFGGPLTGQRKDSRKA